MPNSKKRTAAIAYEHYIFEIVDWTPEYSFGTNHGRLRTSLYSDHSSLTIIGNCIFPSPLVGRTTSMILVGERDIQNPSILEYEAEWKPRCVGVLEFRKERSDFYAAVPYDALLGVGAYLSIGRFRYVLLYGHAMKRGKSLAQSIDFQSSVSLEDY